MTESPPPNDDDLLIRRTYGRFIHGFGGPLLDDPAARESIMQNMIDELNDELAAKGYRVEVPPTAYVNEGILEKNRFAIRAEAIVLLTPRQDIEWQLVEARKLLLPFKWWRLHNWNQRRWIHKKHWRNVRELEQILREMDATGAE